MRQDSAVPYVSHAEIVALDLPLDRVFAAVEAAFIEHGKGMVEMPPKIGVHTRPGTFIHAMPSYIPSLGACGVKWVSGYPENAGRGLPTIAGLMILNDPQTGLPLALLDARWITAIRTAVVSALIVRSCGRPGVRTLAIAGCGVQGSHHLRCLLHVLPDLREVRLYDLRGESASALRDEASSYSRVPIQVCSSVEACLRGAEAIATCTSGAIEVEDGWLPPGGTAVGVDSKIAWGKLFRTIDKFIMDDERQAREFDKAGKYPGGLPRVYAELGEILVGKKPGRERPDERILGLPLGLAIADLAVAHLIWKTVRA